MKCYPKIGFSQIRALLFSDPKNLFMWEKHREQVIKELNISHLFSERYPLFHDVMQKLTPRQKVKFYMYFKVILKNEVFP